LPAPEPKVVGVPRSSRGESLELYGVRVAAVAARLLPRRWALAFGRAIGRGAYALGLRRQVYAANLARAFGTDLDAPARAQIARRAYAHLGQSGIEFLRLPRCGADWLRAHVEFADVGHLEAARARGCGVIIASGHLGGWEVGGAALAARGFPVTFVVQRLRNRRVDALVNGIRRAAGIEVIERGMALRGVHAALAANRAVFMMCDQDARQRGVFVPFFGHLASTPKGAAQLAIRTGAAFVPAFIVRGEGDTFAGRFTPAVIPPAGDEAAAVAALLGEFNRRLEAAIRTAPEQYFWGHRRWKTAPPESGRPAPAGAGSAGSSGAHAGAASG
jgi:KDO2-lipid IV(A) lauroyltransferase